MLRDQTKSRPGRRAGRNGVSIPSRLPSHAFPRSYRMRRRSVIPHGALLYLPPAPAEFLTTSRGFRKKGRWISGNQVFCDVHIIKRPPRWCTWSARARTSLAEEVQSRSPRERTRVKGTLTTSRIAAFREGKENCRRAITVVRSGGESPILRTRSQVDGYGQGPSDDTSS